MDDSLFRSTYFKGFKFWKTNTFYVQIFSGANIRYKDILLAVKFTIFAFWSICKSIETCLKSFNLFICFWICPVWTLRTLKSENLEDQMEFHMKPEWRYFKKVAAFKFGQLEWCTFQTWCCLSKSMIIFCYKDLTGKLKNTSGKNSLIFKIWQKFVKLINLKCRKITGLLYRK